MKSFRGGVVALCMAATACTPNSPGEPGRQSGADVSLPSGTSAPAPNDRSAVEHAYVRFWELAGTLDRVPEAERHARLGEWAVDPELSRAVDGLKRLQEQSIGFYGTPTARVSGIDVNGGTAVLRDCQDASQSGQVDTRTGARKTVGVARNPVTATLLRGADGAWRVSEIGYPGGDC